MSTPTPLEKFLATHPELRAENDGHRSLDRFRARLHHGAAVCSLPPLQSLVDDLLFLPGESVIYSPPKTGKTFVALDLALSVATSTPWMGRAAHATAVLYVAAEGVGGLGARVAAWCERHDRPDISAASFLTTPVNLGDVLDVSAVCTLAMECGAELVVIDTLARCAAGVDENSAKDMGRIVAALDQIRDVTGHVCAVHHAGKDTTKGLRGSSALLGAVDTVIELSGDPHALRLAITDQKDAEAPEPWWCRLTPAGQSVVVETIGASDVITASQRKVLDALEALPAEDRTATKWQDSAADRGGSRTVFFDAKKALLVRGAVAGAGGRGALYRLPEGAE